MAVSPESLASAWNALWKVDTPYDLRSAMQNGKRVGLVWFRPLSGVTFPATGPIVILNRDPWGIVSVDFTLNEISQFQKVNSAGFQFDPAKGTFTAKLDFSELKCAGNYVVHRGKASGSAIKTAVAGLGLDAVSDDPNIALAKSYQQELINSPTGSGRFLVGTHYDNNDAYVKAFSNDNFAFQWATYKTNGKATKDFATQTANAAQPANRGTVPVNQDNDYNLHALYMQTALATTCFHQGNHKASTAVSTFYNNYALPESKNNPTVNGVLNTVNTTPPPPPSSVAALRTSPPSKPPSEPWMKEVLEKVQPTLDAIAKEEDDIRRGIILPEQTERPIPGQYRSYFAAGPLIISGSVREGANGEITAECTGLTGPIPTVDVKLGVFPGALYNELQAGLEKAEFLKAVLGKKVLSALGGRAFLAYVSRMLTLAAGEKLGPVGR